MQLSSALFGVDVERIIHSLKTALACLIGYVVTKSLDFHFDIWLTVTIIVVMCAQVSVGSILQKSYLRFVGTLLGTIVALLTVDFVGHDNIAIACIIALNAMFFSFFASGPNNLKEAGTLGAVTTTIILLAPEPSTYLALVRLSEITAGIVISALVSSFILPIHARDHIKRSQKQTLQQLYEYYKAMLVIEKPEINMAKITELEYAIVQSLTLQRSLSKDAGREYFHPINFEHFQIFLNCEVEILRSINFMHLTLEQSTTTYECIRTLSALPQFHQDVLAVLMKIRETLSKKDQGVIIVIPDLAPIKTVLEKTPLATDDRTNVDTYLFCANVLLDNLRKLAKMYNALATEQTPAS